MTGWHAAVPIKLAADRKTRLRGALSPAQITALTDRMLHHVLRVLAMSPSIGAVTLVTAERPADWSGDCFPDPGHGLNEALDAFARTTPRRLLILHADLPALTPDDIAAMTAQNAAIAPDQGHAGTNAIALYDVRDMRFSFGVDSFARHRTLLPEARIIERPGLMLDIDRPEDLAAAQTLGCL